MTAALPIDPSAAAATHDNPVLTNLNRREIPSLYGLRGAAALAVVVWHFLDPFHLTGLFPGPYAVTLFFELSGLLITWLLLKERESTGHVNLRQFYARRSLRLFPVFYVVWAICCLAMSIPGSWFYFFYLGDYYTALTGHYSILTPAWSLGVEEKFYLLWPFVLLRFETRKLIPALLTLLVAEPIYRLILAHFGHATYTWFAFDTHLDAILLGCLIALLAYQRRSFPNWLTHPAVPLLALAAVFALQHVADLVTYSLAVLLLAVIARPPRLLNNPVARYLGLISYSLYLIHPYAASVVWPRLFPAQSTTLWIALPGQLVLSLVLATALHFAVERPFLRLKNRFHKVA